MTSAGRLPLWSPQQAWTLAGVFSLVASAAAAGLLLDADGYHIASIAAIAAGFVASLLFFHQSWKGHRALRRELESLRRKYAEVYGRAGISIWQEDWSAVGEAIERLRATGVGDIAQWYASRPAEARALHAQVRITDVNRHSVSLMRAGSSKDLIGPLAEVLPGSGPAFGRWLAAFGRGDEVYVGESVIQRCDGEPFDCLVTAALPKRIEDYAEIIVSIIEVSSYKRDQASLAQAREDIARTQRIATVGALTASIAHEVNSPLAAIASNAAACLRWLGRPAPDLEEAKEAAAAVIVEADRARAVIDRTRSYLQKSERREEITDLRALIHDSLRLVRQEVDAHEISVSLDLAGDLGSVRCEPIPLQQALVNLMVNAIQAMSRIDRERRLIIAGHRAETGIRIAIEDTGSGIAARDLRRIFEPFYSTKDGGMGMGLSICRTTIEAHGGSVAIHSTPGHGTCFDIMLPQAK